jgi:hypothetical protein
MVSRRGRGSVVDRRGGFRSIVVEGGGRSKFRLSRIATDRHSGCANGFRLLRATRLNRVEKSETGRSRPRTNPERTREMESKPADLRVEMAENEVESGENRGHFRRKSPPGAGCSERITRVDQPTGPVHALERFSFEWVKATRRAGRAVSDQEPSRPIENRSGGEIVCSPASLAGECRGQGPGRSSSPRGGGSRGLGRARSGRSGGAWVRFFRVSSSELGFVLVGESRLAIGGAIALAGVGPGSFGGFDRRVRSAGSIGGFVRRVRSRVRSAPAFLGLACPLRTKII